MSKTNSILNSVLKVAIALGLIFAISGLSAHSAEASSGPWFAVATGTCTNTTITGQIVGGANVLIVGGGLMPGSSFAYTVSAYGQTSRGLTWALRQTSQADQNGNFCVVALKSASTDQGNFKAQINGVDYLMRQYNPAAQIFTVTPQPATITVSAKSVVTVSKKVAKLPVKPVISTLPVAPTKITQ